MHIETFEDLETATARLERRPHAALVEFIASLAFDTGPIGDKVRTFIVGDDVVETAASLHECIRRIGQTERDYDLRHRAGADIGQRMENILDGIETLILVQDPPRALDLLVALLERDGDAMEACGDHHDSVAVACERAIRLIRIAGKSGPRDAVLETLRRLAAHDDYGTRARLATVACDLATEDPQPLARE